MTTTILVSETEDGPTMPAEAFVALQKMRIQEHVAAFLDEQGVPHDDAVRVKATCRVNELIEGAYAKMLAQIEATGETRQ